MADRSDEALRIELGNALVRIGAGEDESVLFEWHPCVDRTECRAAADPVASCACSGIPYLSDAAWAELAPIVHRVQRETGASTSMVEPRRRLRACVENWPGAETGRYDPRCCRWPKSCSADIYEDDLVTEDDLWPREEAQ